MSQKRPEHATASMQELRDNTSQSKKDLKMKWTGINGQYEKESQVETEHHENRIKEIQLEALK